MQQIQIHPHDYGLYVFYDMAHGVQVSKPMTLEDIKEALNNLETFYNTLKSTPKIIT